MKNHCLLLVVIDEPVMGAHMRVPMVKQQPAQVPLQERATLACSLRGWRFFHRPTLHCVVGDGSTLHCVVGDSFMDQHFTAWLAIHAYLHYIIKLPERGQAIDPTTMKFVLASLCLSLTMGVEAFGSTGLPDKSSLLIVQSSPRSDDAAVSPSVVVSLACVAVLAIATANPWAVSADEYGVEREAPTLFTGENVLKCTRRGPLGACLQTETRTADNDNDKSLKYFRDPSESIKRKDREMRGAVTASEEGNALIEKLRRQTEDNKEKNDLLVKQKTLLNDQVRRIAFTMPQAINVLAHSLWCE